MMNFTQKQTSLHYESGNKAELDLVLPDKPLNKTWPDTDSKERFFIVSEDDADSQGKANNEEQNDSEEVKEEIKKKD